jgi:hypothetical protein
MAVRVSPSAGGRYGKSMQRLDGRLIVSAMATSSPEDAPRGMDFLYSGHRFNVAVYRARGLAVLLCSPDLLKVHCRTPEEMRLANALCRFVELSVECPNA